MIYPIGTVRYGSERVRHRIPAALSWSATGRGTPESRRRPRRPWLPRWATCGLIAPQQTKPLFDDLVRAAERRERETTVTSGHATLATRGHYPLLGPDFHRLDRTNLRLVHSLDYLVGERA
jgi:hypothetical protein